VTVSESPAFQFHLDTAEPILTGANDYSLAGWVVASEAEQAHLSLLLTVDQVEYPVQYGISRPDVAAALGRPDASRCGFGVRFEIEQSNPVLRLYGCLPDGKQLLTQIRWNSRTRAVETHVLPTTQDITDEQWYADRMRSEVWQAEEVPDRLSSLNEFPLISVVVPVSKPTLDMLRHCIRSVLRQHYWNWELCIAGDFSRSHALKDYVKGVAEQNPRVKLIDSPGESKLASLKNRAVVEASGQFVSFLSQHDEVHNSALIEIVRAINSNPSLNLIYTDEDAIDTASALGRPVMKAAFDADMLRSHNYLGNLLTIRRSLVTQIGSFRSETGEGHSWDLALRLSEQTDEALVHHLRMPLYHWRHEEVSERPAPLPASEELYENIVREHISRQGFHADVEKGIMRRSVRVKYSVPLNTNVAVIVRTEDGAFQACSLQSSAVRMSIRYYACVGSVVTRVGETELGLRSPDLQGNASLRLSSCSRAGDEAYGASVRSLVDIIGDVAIFVNGPLETVNHSFIEELTAQALRGDCGVVSGIALSVEGTILHSGMVRGWRREPVDAFAGLSYPQTEDNQLINVVRRVDGISDHFFATRREHLIAVGGLPAISGAHMQRLVMRLVRNADSNGLKVVATPYAVASFHRTT
jgi:glycosyltransferase involved in cell wall biosynthesis